MFLTAIWISLEPVLHTTHLALPSATLLAGSFVILEQHRYFYNYAVTPESLFHYKAVLRSSILWTNWGITLLTANICPCFLISHLLQVFFFCHTFSLRTMPYFIFTFCLPRKKKQKKPTRLVMYFVLLTLHPLTQQVFLAHTIPIHIKTERKFNGQNRKLLQLMRNIWIMPDKKKKTWVSSTGIHYPVYPVNPAPHACQCFPIWHLLVDRVH